NGLHHLHYQWRGEGAPLPLERPGEEQDSGLVRLRAPEDHARDGEGRGRVPALRPVRRALPDRRLGHAEIPDRYDAGRQQHRAISQESRLIGVRHQFPMSTATTKTTPRIEALNDFVVKFANVNGSGSASANELFAKSFLRMGIPVSPRNIFP